MKKYRYNINSDQDIERESKREEKAERKYWRLRKPKLVRIGQHAQGHPFPA